MQNLVLVVASWGLANELPNKLYTLNEAVTNVPASYAKCPIRNPSSIFNSKEYFTNVF